MALINTGQKKPVQGLTFKRSFHLGLWKSWATTKKSNFLVRPYGEGWDDMERGRGPAAQLPGMSIKPSCNVHTRSTARWILLWCQSVPHRVEELLTWALPKLQSSKTLTHNKMLIAKLCQGGINNQNETLKSILHNAENLTISFSAFLSPKPLLCVIKVLHYLTSTYFSNLIFIITSNSRLS